MYTGALSSLNKTTLPDMHLIVYKLYLFNLKSYKSPTTLLPAVTVSALLHVC
jgi:hypothetical protein